MTMSIRRMTLGSGYRYLMSSVAQSDGASQHPSALTRYYADSGTPPGRFLGAGLAGLGDGVGIPAGTEVTEEHLFRMLGMLQDPLTGAQLGRAPQAHQTHYTERVAARIRTETADLRGTEHAEAVDRIRAEERARQVKAPKVVAGFDLTFSAPKSVSVAWALADAPTQAVIYGAHQQALARVIAYAEQCVFTSRSGKAGVVQEEIAGVVAAAFDHWDSRAGDPQLHTHVVVMNRAQSADGVWRTLDSRGMFRAAVGLSEMYNAVLSDHLTTALGWGWEPTSRKHSVVPKYEVAGVPQRLQQEFSARSTAIEDAVALLIPDFITAHGRAPSSPEILRLRQQATLSTRPDKQARLLGEQMRHWRQRAAGLLDTDPVAWVSTLAGRNDLPLLHSTDLVDGMLAEVAAVAVHTVADKRATFSRANVFAETLRELHGVRFTGADERMGVVERTVTLALGQVLLLTPPEVAHTPAPFTRPDGTSTFRARGFEVYTTAALLDAEARLLDAGRDTTGPRLDPATLAPITDDGLVEARRLAPDQVAAITQVATSGRVLDVLVGPAGTGKSVTMGGLRAGWEQQHGPGSVVGLAPSAAAAQVLAEEFGTGCENTSKWLTEHARNPERLTQIDTLHARLHRASPSIRTSLLRRKADRLAAEVEQWSLHPGQLVIVDEASLAGTFALDTLAAHAREAGAKVVLVGDWAQLSPVQAGGGFALLVRDRDHAPALSDVRRFTHDWEKTASVELRIGNPDAIATYTCHDRVQGGDRESMLDLLYAAWRTDTTAGLRSLMIAGDTATVAELNQRARADQIAAGTVTGHGKPVRDGVLIGVGDLVVTRRNDRRLAAGAGWVKNGDTWTVTKISKDGAVTVTRAGRAGAPGGTAVTLPAQYAREHLELGYATTAHRAQGRTVDTAHAFVTVTTGREVLYVGATRGRHANTLYVDTLYDPDPVTAHGQPAERDPADVLRQVLATPLADVSATETMNSTFAEQHSIARLWAEYATIAAAAHHQRYEALLASSGLDTGQLALARRSAAFGPLLTALRDAETRGLNVERALPRLIQGRTLGSADDVAAVLHGRVTKWTRAAGGRYDTVPDRIAGLFPAVSLDDPDAQRGLTDREELIQDRARQLASLAVEHGQAWAAQLGRPPAEPVRREPWMRQLDTIAAYRERWGITGGSILGNREPASTEQEEQRHIAQRAIDTALQIHRSATARASGLGQPLDRQLSREGIQL